MSPRFLQIHTLTPYAGTLLNRDDAGFAKRLRFGGKTRTRVSSQCLKRHWRMYDGPGSLDEIGVPKTIRSRRTFEEYVVKPLVEEGLDDQAVRAATEAVMIQVLGESAKTKAKKAKQTEEEKQDPAYTAQVTVLGRPEINFFKDMVAALAKELGDKRTASEAKNTKAGKADEAKQQEALVSEAKKLVKTTLDKGAKENLRTMKTAAGLGAALFGRMVTSDILARADAAIHVAHSFTVHEQEPEDDYFSAIDDLVVEVGEQGSGHINSTELTSGLFYGYVVVDLPLLVSNLTGCERGNWASEDLGVGSDVIGKLLHIIATVSPGAKLGSTAPYSYAHLLLVEAGNAQPRTLANAFLKPVYADDGDILTEAYRQLSAHVTNIDHMYPYRGQRCFAALGPAQVLDLPAERKSTIGDIVDWTDARIVEGQ